DRVVIGVGRNLSKKTLFDADQRVALMREACKSCRNVDVKTFDKLQVTFAKEVGATFIIRGIRALSDFEFEFEMGNMNRKLAPGIEMVYLMTAPDYLFLSASRVKERVAFGAPFDGLALGSVVLPLTQSFSRLAERYLDRAAFVVGPGVKTGVRLRVDNPSEVGADRIANTLAAHRRYGGPAVVVDFGTTTNFDVVS